MSGLARLLAGAAIAAGIFALAAWTARGGWLAGPVWILVAWFVVGTILIASVVMARRAMGGLGAWQVGERAGACGGVAKRRAHDRARSLRQPGTSAALHVAAADRRAAEVLARAGDVLRPTFRRQRHLARGAMAALALALVGLRGGAAGHGRAAPGSGIRWLRGGRSSRRCDCSARTATVARGERGVLDLAAIGHRSATLYTRAPGEAWRATTVALDTAGNATFTTPPLAADLVARVEAGGRKSPEVHVGVRLAAFLGAFTATAHYPAYLGLEDESLPTTGDTLVLPEGTRLTIVGRATTALASARLSGPDGDIVLAVAGCDVYR